MLSGPAGLNLEAIAAAHAVWEYDIAGTPGSHVGVTVKCSKSALHGKALAGACMMSLRCGAPHLVIPDLAQVGAHVLVS
jgi:hypothetical protein